MKGANKNVAVGAFYGLLVCIVGSAIGVGLGTVGEQLFGSNASGRDSVLIHTDNSTGCQYLIARGTGLFPRLGADGRPLCKELRP